VPHDVCNLLCERARRIAGAALYVKNPDRGKIKYVPRPEVEWIETHEPELREALPVASQHCSQPSLHRGQSRRRQDVIVCSVKEASHADALIQETVWISTLGVCRKYQNELRGDPEEGYMHYHSGSASGSAGSGDGTRISDRSANDNRRAMVLGIFAGCVGTTDQVVPTGHGTFMIPSQGLMGWSSGSAEKAKAFEDAAAYCMKLGKEVETVLASESEGGFGGLATPEIEFRCVPPGDGSRFAARNPL
jgi:hypothetical protein